MRHFLALAYAPRSPSGIENISMILGCSCACVARGSANRWSLTASLEVLWNLGELLQLLSTVLEVTGSLPLLTGPQPLLDHLHNLLVNFAKGERQSQRAAGSTEFSLKVAAKAVCYINNFNSRVEEITIELCRKSWCNCTVYLLLS